MLDLRLEYPVITIDNKLLLPAGTVLSEKTIEILVSGNNNKIRKSNLLSYSTIKEDMTYFFNLENYSIVFSNQNISKTVLKIMKKVNLF